MKQTVGCRAVPTSAAFGTVMLVAVWSGCGGDSGSSVVPPATSTPTPIAIPGQAFTGNFAGTMALDSGRTGAVALNVKSDETATGTLTVTGGATPETVPLTGFVALSNGDFSLSGSSTDGLVTTTVSGTLPALSAGPGFLAIQIGTSIFEGTISAS